jgi:hypothetical protein
MTSDGSFSRYLTVRYLPIRLLLIGSSLASESEDNRNRRESRVLAVVSVCLAGLELVNPISG